MRRQRINGTSMVAHSLLSRHLQIHLHGVPLVAYTMLPPDWIALAEHYLDYEKRRVRRRIRGFIKANQ
jgi:hypothetical protein